MRKILLSLIVVVALLSSFGASALSPGDMAQKPWSTGLLIGFSVGAAGGGAAASFAMEIPVEYAFVLGPGNLIPHFSFMLNAGQGGWATIALPLGVRYKMQVVDKYPIYVYPLFDIGPGFVASGGSYAFGVIRFGAGVSYMVHPNIELVFQPLGLGAAFASGGGAFVYNFELGAQAHF